jgi:hypothetical protein
VPWTVSTPLDSTAGFSALKSIIFVLKASKEVIFSILKAPIGILFTPLASY